MLVQQHRAAKDQQIAIDVEICCAIRVTTLMPKMNTAPCESQMPISKMEPIPLDVCAIRIIFMMILIH